MSLYGYRQSLDISAKDPSFASLIMAALRKADSINALKLENMWPGICSEMQERYNAPGGLLEGEKG